MYTSIWKLDSMVQQPVARGSVQFVILEIYQVTDNACISKYTSEGEFQGTIKGGGGGVVQNNIISYMKN